MCYCALWSFFYLIAGSVLAAGADQYQRYVGYEAWGAASVSVCRLMIECLTMNVVVGGLLSLHYFIN